MTRRKEYVAWDAGVQDGLNIARLEVWAAMRNTVQVARAYDVAASVAVEEGDHELAMYAIAAARNIRRTIRRMIGAEA